MLILTTTAEQTVQPGQPIIFNTVLFQTGNGESCRNENRRIPTTSAIMRNTGVYAPTFEGNIGSVAAGPAQITMQLEGSSLSETLAIVPTAAAGDLTHVNVTTRLRNIACCGNGDRVSVINSGTAAITVGVGASLILERRS